MFLLSSDVHTEVENSASSEGDEVYKPNAPSKDEQGGRLLVRFFFPEPLRKWSRGATMRKPEGVDPLQEASDLSSMFLHTCCEFWH